MNLPERDGDGDGYLTDMSRWTPKIGRAMAEADSIELDNSASGVFPSQSERLLSVSTELQPCVHYVGKDVFERATLWRIGVTAPLSIASTS